MSLTNYVFWLVLLLLLGCTEPAPTPATATAAATGVASPVRELPVTFTPVPTPLPATPSPQVEATASPTGAAATAVPFDQTVVQLHYRIPALGLDRRLEGNVSSQIIFVDEAAGLARQRNNQATVLLELQQALPRMELSPLPEECPTCVYVEYELPFSDRAEAGWLQNPTLLASVENILAVTLGPHFPPDTVAGLRRSASPYAPAHSVALTADGRLWVWLATEAQVDEAVSAATVAPALLSLLDDAPVAELSDNYLVECAGVPVETLYLNAAGEEKQIVIACPEFALPVNLLPIYVQLDAALADKVAEVALPRPPVAFPLDALLDYRRADGDRLTLYQDGRAVAGHTTDVYTSTITTAEVISLTTNLLESGLVRPGLNSFQTTVGAGTATPAPPAIRLLVRGAAGVYDASWPRGAAVPAALAELDQLLDGLLGEVAEPEATITPTATATGGNN